MAEEILRSRHAFGNEADIDDALLKKKIDQHDILFLTTADGKHKIGWIDKDGNKIILDDHDTKQVILVEELPEAGENEVLYIYDSKFYYWDGEKFVSPVDLTGVDEATVDQKVATAVDSVNVYTDEKVAAISEEVVKSYEKIKYEIFNKPVGTLVNYGENEIRVMCPADTQWVKQSVGSTGNANMYYMGFKAYAPEDAVGFKEGDQGVIIDEYFDFTGDFAGTDEFGRNYSIVWFALASYDEATDTWTYFGINSSTMKYIGWTYVVEWYNADGIVIASDSIRINLSNEECHTSVEPYYVAKTKNDIDTKLAEMEEKISSMSVEVIEF